MSATDYAKLAIEQVIAEWQKQNKRVDDMLSKFSAEQFHSEIAPGKNTGIYLLGHLIAVNDNIHTFLGFERSYGHYEEMFVKNADKSGFTFPPLEELKIAWHKMNEALAKNFSSLSTEDWFTKHTAVSQADFEANPQRNKLNIVINRTNHQSYHVGQMVLLG
ncbi:DinB family protein [Pinibacter soli]|uniref:DinB family protein n=1 Tax=Pinibacter soli TaxID=3044211 RepID=A0ABT6RCU3_9BACT|nr:DinB family protein [Pinibacter soli]MDI3320205.1 DinB family protein [Pinibacter soli]